MKKTNALVSRLLEELEKTGIMQIACDKVGISRNTLYRWMKESKELLAQVSEAQSLGIGVVNDVAQSNVITGIKNKDVKYTMYWLSHRHPDFRRPYVHKIDADDLIFYERSIAEGARKSQLMRAIERAESTSTEEEKEERIANYMAFQDRWQKQIDKSDEERAQKLFEKWKEEYKKNPTPSRKRPYRRK